MYCFFRGQRRGPLKGAPTDALAPTGATDSAGRPPRDAPVGPETLKGNCFLHGHGSSRGSSGGSGSTSGGGGRGRRVVTLASGVAHGGGGVVHGGDRCSRVMPTCMHP